MPITELSVVQLWKEYWKIHIVIVTLLKYPSIISNITGVKMILELKCTLFFSNATQSIHYFISRHSIREVCVSSNLQSRSCQYVRNERFRYQIKLYSVLKYYFKSNKVDDMVWCLENYRLWKKNEGSIIPNNDLITVIWVAVISYFHPCYYRSVSQIKRTGRQSALCLIMCWLLFARSK